MTKGPFQVTGNKRGKNWHSVFVSAEFLGSASRVLIADCAGPKAHVRARRLANNLNRVVRDFFLGKEPGFLNPSKR